MPSLIRIPFDESLLPKVSVFDCGTEPWQHEVSEWIKRQRGAGRALDEIECGLQVWLYATDAGELVGFGSLGPALQRWPAAKDPEIAVSIIPFMGIDRRFWGQPPGVPWQERYSGQILGDVVAEAAKSRDARPILKLLVYEGNAAAIKLYERVGFTEYHKPRKDKESGLLYKRMALDLRVPNIPDR
jgi:GNAT superfamily N-acetyltransferase